MKRHAISVIVPTYNCARFIGEAIESIRAQTLPVDQIIIVDDGSTDDTAEAVSRFQDPRIEYIKQANAGIAGARNTGLDAVRGELVTFLDADDRWRPTFVERLHRLLAEDCTAVCAFANFVRFNHSSGEFLSDQFRYYPELPKPEPGEHVRIPAGLAFPMLVSCAEFPAYCQVMMFRRSMIEGMRFDRTLYLGEDSNFALRTFMHGAVLFTDEVLAEVRRHDSNTTRDHREMVVHTLNGLKALAPHVTGKTDLAAYRDRIIKAYISAALYQTITGRLFAGLGNFWEGLRVPGSLLRKIKGSVRLAMTLPRGIVQ